jgi:hypothetical protein
MRSCSGASARPTPTGASGPAEPHTIAHARGQARRPLHRAPPRARAVYHHRRRRRHRHHHHHHRRRRRRRRRRHHHHHHHRCSPSTTPSRAAEAAWASRRAVYWGAGQVPVREPLVGGRRLHRRRALPPPRPHGNVSIYLPTYLYLHTNTQTHTHTTGASSSTTSRPSQPPHARAHDAGPEGPVQSPAAPIR